MRNKLKNLSLVLVLMATAWSPAAFAQEVHLREKAAAASTTVLLSDVAEVRGLPVAIAATPVATLSGAAKTASITISQVQAALGKAGVNIAPISFSGAARCSVSVTAAQQGEQTAAAAPKQEERVAAARAAGDSAKEAPAASTGAPAADTIARTSSSSF